MAIDAPRVLIYPHQPRRPGPRHLSPATAELSRIRSRRRLRRRWPGVSAGLCLGRPARRTPGHIPRGTRIKLLIRNPDRYCVRVVLRAPVVQLAIAPSTPRWRRCARFRRALPRHPLPRILAAGEGKSSCQPRLSSVWRRHGNGMEIHALTPEPVPAVNVS
jgi:hypothetical protein